MGEITEKRMRHYVGVDADKASIPAAGKEKGDSYHANDKGKQYYWNGTAWKTGLGYEYVSRKPAAWDKTLVDFTNDGTWKINGLDLSGIVPADAVAVVLRLQIADDAANSFFQISSDSATDLASIYLTTQVANLPINGFMTAPIEADRLLDYMGANLVFSSVDLAVFGWFI